MSNEPEYLYIEPALHVNSFKEISLKDAKHSELLNELLVMFDGSIIGIKKSSVEKYMFDEKIKAYRLGFLKNTDFLRKNKDVEITYEDLYKLFATMVPLKEYSYC